MFACLTIAVASPARAQAIAALEPVRPVLSARPPVRPSAPSVTAVAAPHPWTRPVLSLAVPGSGQLVNGQARGLVYLAVEAWVVSRALAAGQRGRAERAQYRALAYNIARRAFTPIRVDGPFDYYETMEKFVDSGVYDRDPGNSFVPETDTTTFNGFVWQLARRTFFVNPDSAPDPSSLNWNHAVAFYAGRAVGPNFRWSWRGARLEQDVYRVAIRSSDDAFRERTNYFGALVLNHLASAIDALISARMGHRPAAMPQVRVETAPGGVTLLWTGSF